MRSPDIRAFLPLKPVDLELLMALAREDLHGYGLVHAVAAHTGGLLVLDPGNLYRVIRRLLADGLIAEAGSRQPSGAAGERRRYYTLTPIGGRVLAAELARLRSFVESPSTKSVLRKVTP